MIIKKYALLHTYGDQDLQLPQGAEVLGGGVDSGQLFILAAVDPLETRTAAVSFAIYPEGEDIGVKKLKGKYLATVRWWGCEGEAHMFEL